MCVCVRVHLACASHNTLATHTNIVEEAAPTVDGQSEQQLLAAMKERERRKCACVRVCFILCALSPSLNATLCSAGAYLRQKEREAKALKAEAGAAPGAAQDGKDDKEEADEEGEELSEGEELFDD